MWRTDQSDQKVKDEMTKKLGLISYDKNLFEKIRFYKAFRYLDVYTLGILMMNILESDLVDPFIKNTEIYEQFQILYLSMIHNDAFSNEFPTSMWCVIVKYKEIIQNFLENELYSKILVNLIPNKYSSKIVQLYTSIDLKSSNVIKTVEFLTKLIEDIDIELNDFTPDYEQCYDIFS